MKNLYTTEEWATLKKHIEKWKETGHDLVFTNGCFDILHAGHEALLEFARKQGGKTLVGLNSDNSVNRLKGEGRPVNPVIVRAKNLLSTGYVDSIVIYGEDTPREIIDHIEPDILIKGDDYNFETTIGAAEVVAKGGEVLFFERLPGISTTGLLENTNKNIETNKE
ncbi:MAG: adenylyltransferase/cytidyltransferase family protein [Candidatus Marinimicrobia bacterium]|nr:adenylyltransferase/cytidyltransferase family protein [Candidatus Neomarinimicrobiota bacterium]